MTVPDTLPVVTSSASAPRDLPVPLSWKKRLRRMAMSFCLVTTPTFAITTATITQSAMAPDCVEYRVVGVCYWLFCTWTGCTVRTSVKVRHYVPDLVVSAYNNPGDNPWSEMSFVGAPLPGAEGGGDTHGRHANEHSKVRFKSADAIGHPGGYIASNLASQSGYACATSATPVYPYFVSTLDTLAWRWGVPESAYPEALIPGQREVGQTGDMWGNVYPRAGALIQTHDYKAAAVVAQRVGDLVTRSGQMHVYTPLTASSRDGYWPPGPITEGDKKTHKWQQLSPKLEYTCAIFPNGGASETYSDRLSENGGYVWSLWRPYSCCQRRGQTFLGYTDFM